jgi:hypothetical protein
MLIRAQILMAHSAASVDPTAGRDLMRATDTHA